MKSIIKILSTKTITHDLIQQAKANNFFVEEANFIETKPVETPSVVEKIKQHSNEKIVALFTSAKAVEAVFAQITHEPDWDIFCTSGKTKEAILKHLSEASILNTAPNAAALAQEVVSHTWENPCVFFCGNLRLAAIGKALAENEISFEEVIVYTTKASPKQISETYAGILFFSPSAVESFFSMNNIDHKTVLFSVGKTTTKALRKLSHNQIVTATFPSAESLLKEVRKFNFDIN